MREKSLASWLIFRRGNNQISLLIVGECCKEEEIIKKIKSGASARSHLSLTLCMVSWTVTANGRDKEQQQKICALA